MLISSHKVWPSLIYLVVAVVSCVWVALEVEGVDWGQYGAGCMMWCQERMRVTIVLDDGNGFDWQCGTCSYDMTGPDGCCDSLNDARVLSLHTGLFAAYRHHKWKRRKATAVYSWFVKTEKDVTHHIRILGIGGSSSCH
jgi:hypothetical protein